MYVALTVRRATIEHALRHSTGVNDACRQRVTRSARCYDTTVCRLFITCSEKLTGSQLSITRNKEKNFNAKLNKQAVRLGGRHNMPPPRDLDFLTFDFLALKSAWESHVTWGTPVQSFVFLGLLVFELEPMYATSDGQTDGRTTDADDRLMPPPPYGAGA